LDIMGARLGSAVQGLGSPEGQLIKGGGTVLVQLDMVLKSAQQGFWSNSSWAYCRLWPEPYYI
jgi:hypothetical protein